MVRYKGRDYSQVTIGDLGVVPLNQLGVPEEETAPEFNIKKVLNSIRSNDSIGNLQPYTDYSDIRNAAELSQSELQDAAYNSQNSWEVIGNAVTGAAAIAGTTYISDTLGLVNTLFEFSWDNTVNNYMAELEEEARNANRIYRPSNYDKLSLGEQLGTRVFWADLIQNLGFTIGSGAAAATWAALGNAAGAGSILGQAPKIVQKAVPALMGAFGEASIEAIHFKNEKMEQESDTAYATFMEKAQNASVIDQQKLYGEYLDTLNTIEEDSRKAGNLVYGLNIAALSISNAVQWGDMFTRGFGTGTRATFKGGTDVAYDALELGAKLEKKKIKNAIGTGTAKAVLDSFTEGTEEITQSVISETPNYYDKYNNFNSSKFNPEKREMVSSLLQAGGAALANTMQDPQTAQEFAMGFFTGAIGMPRLRKRAVPISMESGVIGEIKNEVKDAITFNRYVDTVNQRLEQDADLNNYYEGLVRHFFYQDKENQALIERDHKAFADANSAKFISDIVMFDRVGRLDVLNAIIQNAATLTDEEVESLIQETSKDGEGPFLINGNKMPADEVRSKIKEKSDKLLSTVENYKKIKEKIQEKYPTLSQDSMDEALYYRIQSEDLEKRNTSIREDLFSIISEISNLEKTLPIDERVGLKEAMVGITKDNIAVKLAEKNSPLLKAVTDAIQSESYKIPAYDIQTIEEGILDHARNLESLNQYVESFNSLVTDPKKANSKNEQLKQDIATKQEKETRIAENKNIASQVINSSVGDTFIKVRSGDINLDDINIPDLGDLEGSFTDKVKEVKKLQNASVAVEDEITNDDKITEQAKKDAISLFMYGAEHTQDTATVLEPQTFETLTPQQVAEALDVNPENYSDGIAELEKRMAPALEALSRVLPNIEAAIKEAEQMSAMIDDNIIETIEKGNDPITSIESISNEGVEPQAVTTPSRTSMSSTSSSSMNSKNWASGYSYMYTGKDEKHLGKTYKQFVEDEIHALESKNSLTEDEKTLLQQYRNTKKVIDFLYQEGVYTRERQLLVQEGSKVHFIVKPEVSEEIAFIAVKGPNDTYTIVGNLSPNQSKGIIERYRQSSTSTLYIDSATSTVVDKYIGKIPYSHNNDRHDLNTLYPRGFTLGIDLSSNTTTSDIRTQANSKEDTPKNEEEQKIKPTKKGKPGAVYVMVPTSNTKKDSYTAVEAVSRVFNMSNESIPAVKFLLDLMEAEIPISEKLQYLQSILDVDIFVEKQSLTLDENSVAEKYTFTVRNNGKTQTYIKSKSVSDADLIKFILTNVNGQARYTVDRHYINDTFSGTGEDYNTFMGSVLEVNLAIQNPTTIGDWFRIKPISTNGSMVVGKAISEIKPHTKSGENVTKDGSSVTIEKDGHFLSVNTDTWEVIRDGKILTPSEYNIKTYAYLARIFLNNLGHTNGLHITPWGLFNLDEFKFDGDANSLIINAELAGILSDINSKSVFSQISALIAYNDLPESSKTSTLNKYFTKIELELEKQGYTWTHPSNVANMWERGIKENITIQNESIDPNLSYGELRVIGRAPIIEKEGNIISKGIVDIKRGPGAQASFENTTSVITDADDGPDWLKEKSHKIIYNSLNDKAKSSFKQAALSLEGASRKRYINDTIRRLKGMTIEERNAYLEESYFRKVNSTTSAPVIDIDKEVAWLSKVLPQLSKEDRLRVVKGLIKIANSGERAWGMFKGGVMYIAKNAASGTVYHEAFHVVVHTLLSDKERARLFTEAKKQYGSEDLLDLEEAMAEDFRRYTEFQISDSSSYLKNMWSNIKNWTKFIFGKMTAIESTFWRINKGLYRRRVLKESAEHRYRKMTIEQVVNRDKTMYIDQAYDAYTKYKDADTAVREVIKANKIKWETYANNESDLKSMFKNIPNYDKVVKFIEVPETGKSTPVLYTDMWSFSEVSRIKNNPSIKYEIEDMSGDEYLSEKARIEQDRADFAKDGLDSDEYTSYDEEAFAERERRFNEKRMYANLTNEQKGILQKQGVSARAYDAFSPADKESFINCNR